MIAEFTKNAGAKYRHRPCLSAGRRFRLVVVLLFLEVIPAVLLLEFLDPSGCIDKLLLAGVERMAGGAYFHADVLAERRTGGEYVPAGAGYGNIFIFGMYLCLHVLFTFSLNKVTNYTDIEV